MRWKVLNRYRSTLHARLFEVVTGYSSSIYSDHDQRVNELVVVGIAFETVWVVADATVAWRSPPGNEDTLKLVYYGLMAAAQAYWPAFYEAAAWLEDE